MELEQIIDILIIVFCGVSIATVALLATLEIVSFLDNRKSNKEHREFLKRANLVLDNMKDSE